MTVTQRKIVAIAIPFVLAALILGVMALIMSKDTKRLMARNQDQPPQIEFTWSPAGEVSLMEMKGMLTIKDDYALDFTTYRMKLVELDRVLDLPIPGLIGKEYEQPVSFSLIANDPKLEGHSKLTVEISIADDKGQTTVVTKVIPIKKDAQPFQIEIGE